jgi:hypothetical protein
MKSASYAAKAQMKFAGQKQCVLPISEWLLIDVL